MQTRPNDNRVHLIAYIDRFSGGGIDKLQNLLAAKFPALFGGIHLLPFYPPIDGADAGFDPIDHTQVDPRLGDWSHIATLCQQFTVMADLIVNHVSRDSAQFQDFLAHGDQSAYAPLFLTHSRVFPHGATEADLLAIYRPRPALPFTTITFPNGVKRLLWTTFTPHQIDIDVEHPLGQAYLDQILTTFAQAGIRLIRLDAAGYAIKRAGTSCFMLPETFQFIASLSERAQQLGIETLVEIHSHYRQQIHIAAHVDRVYDFALPPLILHALFEGTGEYLAHWLSISPRNAVTVLDTHDGIGVIDVGPAPDGAPGLLPPDAIDRLVETIHARSAGQSRQATGAAASNLDLYQVNCTFYDALGRRDPEYLIARAIQFFAPGIPQIYYVGLLAGHNDMELLARTQVGRDINRHYYSSEEIDAALARPVVARLLDLIHFRNTHPAFFGNFSVLAAPATHLRLEWQSAGAFATLDVDLAHATARITHSAPSGVEEFTIS